jgi:NAD+ synthase (glutamine-hydrolysing)
MLPHGFVRLAAAVPRVRVADCRFHRDEILALLRRAEADGVDVVVFPELCLTGYTCADLFHQTTLQRAAVESLLGLAEQTADLFYGVAVVGLPLVVGDRLHNCAAVLHRGRILGLVPKTYLPNYKEFYEVRWFASGALAPERSVDLGGTEVPFGTDLLFQADDLPGLVIGVEICEDLWVPIPPSSHQALAGATVLANLSASNDLIAKSAYRRDLVVNQSGRCVAAYVYASCSVHESTTDLVFGGHCLIAENGSLLAENQRFQREAELTVADVDLERLRNDRMRMNSFAAGIDPRPHLRLPRERGEGGKGIGNFRIVGFNLTSPRSMSALLPLRRFIDPHPFVPREEARLRERCEEIFHIQVAALAKRLEHLGKPKVSIGISGGLDSTLALLVACKTMDVLGAPRTQIQAFTLPGFGTTHRTLHNALALMRLLGVTARQIDIREMCLSEMKALGHKPFGIDLEGLSVDELSTRLRNLPPERRSDLVFENIQARVRTNLLMNAAFVIGTGDLSELALGWCTYNADHMSMYNPNVSIPKTLVKFLIRWVAENEFEGEVRRVLLDIVDTIISPELLPPDAQDAIVQSTEQTIGPYELHDFFLFHFLRYGASPPKILFLAEQARFDKAYSPDELRRWLAVFLRRFFVNQFKRSCLPDGPKVGTLSLSPRGDWRMPSDAAARLWLEEMERRPDADQ